MKRIIALVAVLTVIASADIFAGARQQEPASSGNTMVVRDLAGREVRLSVPVTRAAAIAGPSYEKVFLLGQADKLAGAHFYMVERPWVKLTNPAIDRVIAIRSPGEPNVETLLGIGVDCALFWDYKDAMAAMENAGIPVVVVQNATGNPRSVEEFIVYQKNEVRVFADVFGEEARKKAEEWYAYFDAKVAYTRARVVAIPQTERKTAIYSYGEEGLGLFSQYSYVSYWLELAGGKNCADATGQEMDTVVTMEEIIGWDPDVIFAGRMDNADPVLNGKAWSELKAVKTGQVYLCPDGVMYWDYSSEGVLLMMFLAQKLYPAYFADLDMRAETRDYYKRFYNYELSAENAERLLTRQPPAP
jgi:iron complex transport system substrate-binding protein